MSAVAETVGLVPPAAVIARRATLRGNFVNGRWAAGSGDHYRHIYAADRSIAHEFRLAGKADMLAAITAAQAAQPAWRALAPAARGELMLRLAELIGEHFEGMAQLQSLDTGLPITISRGLLGIMSEWTRYYAGWCDKIEGASITQAPGGRWLVTREPYGVTAILLTWNMPISSVCMKAMAALAAGNSVVIKTPEMAPFGMMAFAEAVEAANFPPGVINILAAGPEGGEALTADHRIGKISFTGGAATAAKVLRAAADNITPTLFELGGKSACLLFADADLDVAIPFASFFGIAASGQACIVPSRLLVHGAIYDEVVRRVTAIFKTMTLGDPFDATTVFGPVVSPQAVERIEGIIARAVAEKAGRLVVGGKRPGGRFADGNYVEPTLFVDVAGDSALFQNEVFGPVLAISRFDDEAEGLALANATRFGLYAYVFTRDISRALRVADALTSGSVGINGFTGLSPRAPFGGVGISGFGKEGGREGLDEFLRSKTVFIAD